MLGRSLRRDRALDGGDGGFGLGGVGAAGLGHVGAAAAAFAAERRRGDANEIDGVEARSQIVGDADHDAGLAVFAERNDGDDPRADAGS